MDKTKIITPARAVASQPPLTALSSPSEGSGRHHQARLQPPRTLRSCFGCLLARMVLRASELKARQANTESAAAFSAVTLVCVNAAAISASA